jgi:hypothetical protein
MGGQGRHIFDTIPHGTPLLVKKENIELANIGAREHSQHTGRSQGKKYRQHNHHFTVGFPY